MEPNNTNSDSGADSPEPTKPATEPESPGETDVNGGDKPAESDTSANPAGDTTDEETPLEPAKINTAPGAPNITPDTLPNSDVKPDMPKKPKKPVDKKKMAVIGGIIGLVVAAAAAYFLFFVSSNDAYADLQTTSTEVYSVLLPSAWDAEVTDEGTYYFSGETLDESDAFIVVSDLGYDSEIETIVGLEGQDKSDALDAMSAIMEGLIEAGLTSEFDIDETSSEVLESPNADTAVKVSFTGTIKASGLAVQGAYLYLLQSDGTTMFINVSAEDSIWNNNQDAINQIFDSFKPV